MSTSNKIILGLLAIFLMGAYFYGQLEKKELPPKEVPVQIPVKPATPLKAKEDVATKVKSVPVDSKEVIVAKPSGAKPLPNEPAVSAPLIDLAAPYVMKNNIVEIDISEYAGYAGLIVANGGLAPNPNSYFMKEFGFQVKLSISEGENWGKLNNGKFAASATTVDVLAVLGRQFDVVVPIQIGFSRGADMIVVDSGIASINQLKGKVLAATQFNESEFFIRYLAQEAGINVQVLRDLDAKPSQDQIGLVFYEDTTFACAAYQHELTSQLPRLAGCVGWSPSTDEVVENSKGRAKVLTTNRNLLVVADILCVNKGFATANPKIIQGLVHGIIEGNRRVRDKQEENLQTIATAMKWKLEDSREELKKVHLSNLPENLAFFAGTIDAAGSYGGIFQSSVMAYGTKILPNPTDADRFADLSHLKALQSAGQYADQQVAIAPIKTSTRQGIEGDALLSKDIRFLYEPNSAVLAKDSAENIQYLEVIRRYLQVSPGSIVVLNGHVDNGQVEKFRKDGGEVLVRTMALKAMDLSKQRAASVKAAMIERFKGLDASRLETIGRGWEKPAGIESNLNRRVEVQWFTIE